MGSLEKGAGVLLLVIGLMIFLFSLPNAVSSFNTGANSSFENATVEQKQVIKMNSFILVFLPMLMFLIGGAMVYKG